LHASSKAAVEFAQAGRLSKKKQKGRPMANRTLQRLSQRFVPWISASVAVAGLALLALTVPALSAPLHPAPAREQVRSAADIVEIRAVVRRGGVAVGPRGNAVGYRSRTVVRGPAVVRPGYRGGGVRWARPGWYRWPAGGAIAAGAAIGFVAAAGAAAYAGAAPAPGMCWYYTDPSKTQGFWDNCP
jgi:hypothetical protein